MLAEWTWRDSSPTRKKADFALPVYKSAVPVIDLSLLRTLDVDTQDLAVTYF